MHDCGQCLLWLLLRHRRIAQLYPLSQNHFHLALEFRDVRFCAVVSTACWSPTARSGRMHPSGTHSCQTGTMSSVGHISLLLRNGTPGTWHASNRTLRMRHSVRHSRRETETHEEMKNKNAVVATLPALAKSRYLLFPPIPRYHYCLNNQKRTNYL